ncbi:hypothetical protein EDC94DRAFT_653952 [Helicostylum pulchrum]|nr:hypothetical protein EDC94DRAFT_653952 [Helicostylum pulchrum]
MKKKKRGDNFSYTTGMLQVVLLAVLWRLTAETMSETCYFIVDIKIALRDAVFPSSMKGTIPGLARRLVNKNDTENVEIDGVTLLSVLLCPNQTCNTLWQINIKASRNMHYISYTVIATGEVLVIFRR